MGVGSGLFSKTMFSTHLELRSTDAGCLGDWYTAAGSGRRLNHSSNHSCRHLKDRGLFTFCSIMLPLSPDAQERTFAVQFCNMLKSSPTTSLYFRNVFLHLSYAVHVFLWGGNI